MDACAFVRDVEANGIKGAGKTGVVEIDTCHPSVVLTEADAVPQPCFDDPQIISVIKPSAATATTMLR